MTATHPTPTELIAAVKALGPGFSDRAAEGERNRTLPAASAASMIAAQLPRVLVPKRFGGLELDLHTWIDLVIEISKADASHGWCANIMLHEAQVTAAFPEEGQAAVWAETSNVPIAGSVMPVCAVTPVDGGYRVSGKSPFASGVGHSEWVRVAGMIKEEKAPPKWTLFLVAPGEYEVEDTWHTAGMSGTGSNTIVTEDLFVPEWRSVAFADVVNGTTPGAALHDNPMYGLPFASFAQVGFAAAMLGASRGAYETFRDKTRERTTVGGASVADQANVRVGMGRSAVDLDAAEMLLRRVIDMTQGSEKPTLEQRARSVRDCARASELIVGAIDPLIALSGTSGFATSNPIQRAWRDVHFASCHRSLSPETNLGYWAGLELGVERPPHMAVY